MAKRLIQVAKEFNVGITTIVDFLKKKGFDIGDSPRTKLEDGPYDALVREFQKSKAIKNQADQLTIGTRKVAQEEEERERKMEEERIRREKEEQRKKEEEAKKQKEEAERVKRELERLRREEENERARIQAEKEKAEREKAKLQPKIIGKIDLDKVNKPKKIKDESAEPVENTKPPKKEDTKAPTPPPVEKEVKPVVEAVSNEAKEETSEDDSVVRHKTPELRGLKIQGKIDLDKFTRKKTKDKGKTRKEKEAEKAEAKKKKKVDKVKPPVKEKAAEDTTNSTSEEGSDDSKRRRKRRRKKVIKPTNTPTTTPAANDNNSSSSTTNTNNNNTTDKTPQRREVTRSRKPKKTRDVKQEVSQKEIQEKIKATMARISGGGKSKRQRVRRENRETKREQQFKREEEEAVLAVQVTEFVTVTELSNLLDLAVTDVITTCMNAGIIVSINQRLEADIIELIAEEHEREIEFISAEEQIELEEEDDEEDDPKDLRPRAPIVTVMGHVDHGKTSLLDYIREANVAGGEAGGITQHIGAYEVRVGDSKAKITFLDTPGHEAFTAMRARGAKVTDVAVIIIAADDSVMPQTKEAISHAQAAGVPIVFAINKVDKIGANPERIKEQLAGMNLLVEEWGGKYQSQDISAKSGMGIAELLEKIQLEAELLELSANPSKGASGVLLEASLDKGRGYVSKMLVQNGTLKIGDPIVAGEYAGKVKAMFNERGKNVKKVGPSSPVLVLGLSGAPQAGEKFKVMENEQEAKQLASKRAQISREQQQRATRRLTLDDLGRRIQMGNFKQLNLIVKGDVDGSIEALSDSLLKQSIETLQVNIVHRAVGQITESDVLLAAASDAIIIGFQVRPSSSARQLAEKEGVDVRLYSVIYDAIEEVRTAMEGMLDTKKQKEITGQAEVREVYKISKVGSVAGCYVTDGKIYRNNYVSVIRNGIVVYPIKEGQNAEIDSLKRFKDDTKEVSKGLECGIKIKNFNDLKPGDVIESYEIIEVKQTLDEFQKINS